MSPKKKIQKRKATEYFCQTSCGKIKATIPDDGSGYRCTYAKSGGCGSSQNEAISRVIKLILKKNINPIEIQKELIGIQCHQPNEEALSCADGHGHIIEEFIEDHNTEAKKE